MGRRERRGSFCRSGEQAKDLEPGAYGVISKWQGWSTELGWAQKGGWRGKQTLPHPPTLHTKVHTCLYDMHSRGYSVTHSFTRTSSKTMRCF